MAIRIEGTVAYVDTVAEAFEASENEALTDVVIEDNNERIKMQRLLKGFGHRNVGRMDG